jgi:RNA polymerase sigma-70 factor (ECF subfamily)
MKAKADITADTLVVSGILDSDDQKSFEVFYKHFYNRIYLFLLRKVRDVALAKELTNDTFYKIYVNKHKIQRDANFMGYFYAIAYNELRQSLRKRRDIILEDDILEIFSNKDLEREYIISENNEELSTLIRESVKELTTEEQKIIQLRFYDERSLKDISESLSLPIGTIKSKISRTITKLRTIIATKEHVTAYT